MNINDDKLSEVIHCLTSIVTKLENEGLHTIAMKVEEVREDILLSIEDSDEVS